jgi:tRNA wybutosine-synthesizing protein 3
MSCPLACCSHHGSGCWLLASHDPVTADEVKAAYHDDRVDASQGAVMFKFEPFILHVQCKGLEDARVLLASAIDSGLRQALILLEACEYYVQQRLNILLL